MQAADSEGCPYRMAYSDREVVTEGHINAAIRSLQQTRTDLAARQAEMDALESSNDVSLSWTSG